MGNTLWGGGFVEVIGVKHNLCVLRVINFREEGWHLLSIFVVLGRTRDCIH